VETAIRDRRPAIEDQSAIADRRFDRLPIAD
jgi:hypothetical protein